MLSVVLRGLLNMGLHHREGSRVRHAEDAAVVTLVVTWRVGQKWSLLLPWHRVHCLVGLEWMDMWDWHMLL